MMRTILENVYFYFNLFDFKSSARHSRVSQALQISIAPNATGSAASPTCLWPRVSRREIDLARTFPGKICMHVAVGVHAVIANSRWTSVRVVKRVPGESRIDFSRRYSRVTSGLTPFLDI